MLTQCTSPDAPFYHADLAILAILESNGIDVSCDLVVVILLGVLGFVVFNLFLFGVGVSMIWHGIRATRAEKIRRMRLPVSLR